MLHFQERVRRAAREVLTKRGALSASEACTVADALLLTLSTGTVIPPVRSACMRTLQDLQHQTCSEQDCGREGCTGNYLKESRRHPGRLRMCLVHHKVGVTVGHGY